MNFPGMETPHRTPKPRRRFGWVIALATFIWLVTAFVFLCLSLAETLTFFAEQPTAAEQARGDAYLQGCILVLIIGPAVIALFAFSRTMPKTGVAFLVIAVALAVWIGSTETARDLFRPDPQAPAEVEEYDPAQCIPRSGCDSECPGG